jgi:hypothetical protein
VAGNSAASGGASLVSCRALVFGVALVGLLVSGKDAAAQNGPFPASDVRIDVIIDQTSRVSVREEYTLLRLPDVLAFQVLSNRCARVGPVSATIGERPVTFDEERRGPWTYLHGATATGADRNAALRVHVQYEVVVGDIDATVPIVMPAATLERAAGTRGANVDLTVAWSGNGDGAAVIFPRLERTAAGAIWEGRFLAIPSLVRVRAPLGRREPCDAETLASSGGLEWRFWLFTGIMVVWVPLYLWVFGRQTEQRA